MFYVMYVPPFLSIYRMPLLYPEQKCKYKIVSMKTHVLTFVCAVCDMLLIFFSCVCVCVFYDPQQIGLKASLVQVRSPPIQYVLQCPLV